MSFLQQRKQIILASTSSIRKQLLEDVALDFQAVAPLFDEEEAKEKMNHLSIQETALQLAIGKALSVSALHKKAIVIGSDQICELDGKRINKSSNYEEAFLQLKNFSGKIHYQNNATVVALGDKIIFKKISRVKLKMRKISDDEISHYVNEQKPWGCAGSYKYESLAKHLFEKIDGDYFSILGLNLQPLLAFLHKRKFINLL